MEIIKLEVINVVLQFLSNGWLPPNFNPKTIVLTPKVPNADNVNQFGSRALANFKFKFITKINASRLA